MLSEDSLNKLGNILGAPVSCLVRWMPTGWLRSLAGAAQR